MMAAALPISSSSPKYTSLEIERRWLVATSSAPLTTNTSSRHVEDRYIRNTRLRLRKVTEEGKPNVFKLGKKYGKPNGLSEPVVSVYLDETEFATMAKLPPRINHKRRYAIEDGALDVYEFPNPGLVIFEVEFTSEAQACSYTPPGFVAREITGDLRYSGFSLSDEIKLL